MINDWGEALRGQFLAKFKLDVRMSVANNQIVGLDVRNPAMKLEGSAKSISVEGLRFYLEDQLQSNVTLYLNSKAVISSSEFSLIAPFAGFALIYYPQINPEMKIGVQIGNIAFTDETGSENPLPTNVTYTQLMGTQPPSNVFRIRCLNCHQSGSAAGGLDLTDLNLTRNRLQRIQNRVNNSASPMPPSGLLQTSERQLIDSWINNGAPQ